MCSLAACSKHGGIHPLEPSGDKSSESMATELDGSIRPADPTATSLIGMNLEQIQSIKESWPFKNMLQKLVRNQDML